MLHTLRIRNLALVAELTLEFGPGFSVLTGETGAGKSVILGALSLLLGQRADRGAIRSGADQCAVEALFDVASARVRACANTTPGMGNNQKPSVRELFEPAVSAPRLIEAFRSLRVPRRLFKFLYHLIVSHCNSHTDENPSWQISSGLFESTLALNLRDQDAFDRGVGAG